MVIALLVACAQPVVYEDCGAPDVVVTPADGDAHVDRETVVTVVVASDAQPRIWLDGGVDGSVSQDGDTWTFTPDAALAPDTTYTVVVDVCGDETRASFHTVGEPVGESAVGVAWNFDLARADIEVLAPTGGDALLDVIGETSSLLFALGEGLDTLVVAPGWTPLRTGRFEQYPCATTMTLDADFSGDPWFQTLPVDTSLVTAGASFPVESLLVAGEVRADLSAVEDLEISGYVDMRATNAEQIGCSLGDGGDACVPCHDQTDGEASCLFVRLRDPEAERWDGTLEAVDTPASGC